LARLPSWKYHVILSQKTRQFKQNEYLVTLRLIHWILPSISAINGESGLTERSGSAKILNP